MTPRSAQPALPLELETWRPVVGWEGLYEVSDQGNVRSARREHNTWPGRLLRPAVNHGGYLHVGLYRDGQQNGCRVHRLVALAFLGPCPPGHEVNHRFGIKTDNRATELEWATKSANTRHAYAGGLAHAPDNRGTRSCRAKLTEADVLAIRAARGQTTQRALARQFGVSKTQISAIQRREQWAHVA